MQITPNKNTYRLKGFTVILLFIAATAAILGNPSVSSKGAFEGLKLCSSVIIPSLFPFTAVALFFEKSGTLKWFGEKIEPFTFKIFGMNGSVFSAMILSLIGGYPVGAKIADSLNRSGSVSKEDAKLLLRYCVNPGPAFFISVIGADVLKSQKAGIILFIANLSACLLLNTVIFKRKSKKAEYFKPDPQTKIELTGAFVESVHDAAFVLMGICAWVTLFSSVCAILNSVMDNSYIFAVVSPLLEITFGSVQVAKIGVSPWLYSLLLSFGGLSTLCQVKQAAQSIDLSIFKIGFFRLVHGAVATVISFTLFKLFPITKEVISNGTEIIFSGFPMFLPSIALLIFAMLFLIFLKPKDLYN